MSAYFYVITGPMFSGKSAHLIDVGRCREKLGETTLWLKPSMDTRNPGLIASRRGSSVAATEIDTESYFYRTLAIARELKKPVSVLIDEAQFLSMEVAEAITNEFRWRGECTSFFVSGLNSDFRGIPFAPMAHFLACATDIRLEYGTCKVCYKISTKTYRKTDEKSIVVVGDSEIYEGRCQPCWAKGMVERGAGTFESSVRPY